jgi:hypothetical protein
MAFDATKWITTISRIIKEYNPEIDTSLGTMVGDTIVLPLAVVREILDKTKDFVSSIYYLDGILNLMKDPERVNDIATALGISSGEVIMTLRSVIENIASDYGITRQRATYAAGIVYYIPKGDLSLPENWKSYTVSPSDEVKSVYGVFYAPVTTFVFDVNSDNYATYFVPELGAYGFPVSVKCKNSGSIGNIGPGMIDYDFGYYLGSKYDRAINLTPIIGGYDEETDEQLVERIKSKWKGINLGTVSGYKNLLAQYNVKDVYVAGPGDPFMERAVLGAVDVYIRDYQVLTVRISLDLLSLGLKGKTVLVKEVPGLKEYMYIRDIIYNNQSLITSRDNTALWKWSTRANDMVTFPDMDSITVDIVYNSTVAEIQKILDKEENKILGLDIMVREAWPLNFSISCSLTYLPGYSPTIVQQNVKKTLYNYIKSLPLGSKVNRSDVINVIEDVSGVDAVINLQFNPDVETIQASPIEFLNLKEVVIR